MGETISFIWNFLHSGSFWAGFMLPGAVAGAVMGIYWLDAHRKKGK